MLALFPLPPGGLQSRVFGICGRTDHPERSEGSRCHAGSCVKAGEILRCAQNDRDPDFAVLLPFSPPLPLRRRVLLQEMLDFLADFLAFPVAWSREAGMLRKTSGGRWGCPRGARA